MVARAAPHARGTREGVPRRSRIGSVSVRRRLPQGGTIRALPRHESAAGRAVAQHTDATDRRFTAAAELWQARVSSAVPVQQHRSAARATSQARPVVSRLLVIAPQPFFAARGTPLSVYYRTLVMAEQGVEIDLLTYGIGEDVEIPGVRIVRIPRLPFTDSVPIGPSWSKAVLDIPMMLWTVGLLLRHRYDVVHAHEEAVFWCQALKPVFGFRMIYDMHSSLPQQLENFRYTKSRLLLRAFRALERRALASANVVVTICSELRDHTQTLGVAPERQLLIENSIFDE